ncbi:unnamed protein product [Prunus armeniaca]
MPRLSRYLVEHCLPTVEDFKFFKQPPCQMLAEVELQVKEESSKSRSGHLDDLRSAFERMRRHQLKMNPKSAKVIIDAPPPKNEKGVQSLLGQINFLQRFMANSVGKVEPFSSLLKLKNEEQFQREETHQRAFDAIKEYLAKPPVLIQPRQGQPLKLYISGAENSIGSPLPKTMMRRKSKQCITSVEF